MQNETPKLAVCGFGLTGWPVPGTVIGRAARAGTYRTSMPVSYTNRKGATYHLCQTLTKTGRPRYVFAREPMGEPIEEIPDGWRINESVNGVVSLVRDRPGKILPEETTAVEAAVGRHPKSRDYRVAAKRDWIEVYERVGPHAEELVAGLSRFGFEGIRQIEQVRDILDQSAQFSPVLRFILVDAAQRTFRIERMCYRSSVDGWLDVHQRGPVDRLAREWAHEQAYRAPRPSFGFPWPILKRGI